MGPAPSAFCRPAHWSGGGQPAGEKVQLRLTRTVGSLQQGAQGTFGQFFAIPLKELPEIGSIGNKSCSLVVKLPAGEWAARNASGA